MTVPRCKSAAVSGRAKFVGRGHLFDPRNLVCRKEFRNAMMRRWPLARSGRNKTSGAEIDGLLGRCRQPPISGALHEQRSLVAFYELVCGLRGHVAVRAAAPTTPDRSLTSRLRCTAEQLASGTA
jgi:hypothetical protein